MTDGPVRVVVLQSKRGERWNDFAAGSFEAALRHVNQNPPGVWRGITPMGEVVIPPRAHSHSPLFGVSTDGVATCECGRQVTLTDGQWVADWPKRVDQEFAPPDPTVRHTPSVTQEKTIICSCGWSSGFDVHGIASDTEFQRHLQRVAP